MDTVGTFSDLATALNEEEAPLLFARRALAGRHTLLALRTRRGLRAEGTEQGPPAAKMHGAALPQEVAAATDPR
jgi:hypothetical protein